MSNILNSQISSNTNPIPAWKLGKEKKSRLVQAPQQVYTFSIEDELKKTDEFRKSVTLAQQDVLYGKTKSSFPQICLALAAVTTYFIFNR